MIVAIHQPNFAPWLGYFRKIAMADAFVFLDDVQFSKGSYTNRVRILSGGVQTWLSVPVSFNFGAPILAVDIGSDGFVEAHLRRLEVAYKCSASFRESWNDVQAIYNSLPNAPLGEINVALVKMLCKRLGIGTQFYLSSELGHDNFASDDRLIALVAALDKNGTYLSGKGGATYQDPSKFVEAGLRLEYLDFVCPSYRQVGGKEFVSGLSVFDAVFNLGFDGTAALIRS